MAHYTKKKSTGRKKLNKSKVLRSKKRVPRKRITRKLRHMGGVVGTDGRVVSGFDVDTRLINLAKREAEKNRAEQERLARQEEARKIQALEKRGNAIYEFLKTKEGVEAYVKAKNGILGTIPNIVNTYGYHENINSGEIIAKWDKYLKPYYEAYGKQYEEEYKKELKRQELYEYKRIAVERAQPLQISVQPDNGSQNLRIKIDRNDTFTGKDELIVLRKIESEEEIDPEKIVPDVINNDFSPALQVLKIIEIMHNLKQVDDENQGLTVSLPQVGLSNKTYTVNEIAGTIDKTYGEWYIVLVYGTKELKLFVGYTYNEDNTITFTFFRMNDESEINLEDFFNAEASYANNIVGPDDDGNIMLGKIIGTIVE